MSTDNDVLTMLRTSAHADAPPLRLQADDVLRSGRRRRLRNRALVTGAGVLAGAGIVTAAIGVGGMDRTDDPSPAAVGPTQTPPTGFLAQSMPALLKDVGLTPLDPLPEWTEFGVEAFGVANGLSPVRPLPPDQLDAADTWTMRGVAADGAIALSVMSGLYGETEGDPGAFCATELETGDALECTALTDADGRRVIEMWLPPTTTLSGWLSFTKEPDLDAGDQWYARHVEVFEPGSGYIVTVQQATPASSLAEAKRAAWLSDREALEMASAPELDLGVQPR